MTVATSCELIAIVDRDGQRIPARDQIPHERLSTVLIVRFHAAAVAHARAIGLGKAITLTDKCAPPETMGWPKATGGPALNAARFVHRNSYAPKLNFHTPV